MGLETSRFSVAAARPATIQKEHRVRKSRDVAPSDAKMTFGQAAALHMPRVEKNAGIKRRTRIYWKQTLAALLKHRPEPAGMEIKRITTNLCRDWSVRHAKIVGSARYSNTLSLVRQVIDTAIGNGVIYADPATGPDRKTVGPKRLELPARFRSELRAAHKAGFTKLRRFRTRTSFHRMPYSRSGADRLL